MSERSRPTAAALNIVFAGTPAFAATALSALIERRDRISLVLTQPDRPAGRGLRSAMSPVKTLAIERGLSILQPASLREPAVQQRLAEVNADVWVVAAYGLILPAAVLAMPRLGCINIHASLLPRWRGAAPIQRAILAGDAETGVSIMQMDAGLDTGPVLMQEPLRIGDEDTAGTLHDRLAVLGARLMGSVLDRLAIAPISGARQPAEGVTYAAKIEKQEAWIDWTEPAEKIARKIRALNPVPGAYTTLDGSPIKMWRVRPAAGVGLPPGTAVSSRPEQLTISCGEGALAVAELQRPGGRRLPVEAFLRGTPIAAGTKFGT